LRTAKRAIFNIKEILMDTLKIGHFIQYLRKKAGLTQSELAEKLGISFQAVSKWENGDSLPDTGLLLPLSDILGVTVDTLLNGGSVVMKDRRLMRVEDVIIGFEHLEDIGRCFGENCTFFTGMIEGINSKMNIDILEYLGKENTREVMYAEVLIQGILAGRTVDMKEVEENFSNKKMVETIRNFIAKAGGNPEPEE
jgi:transcriptional regulator with XRE-family HTH domain